jgi:hypothetical protein
MINVKSDIQGGEELKPIHELCEVLPDIPKGHLHIIVRRPGK